jgi:hypothetical protein
LILQVTCATTAARSEDAQSLQALPEGDHGIAAKYPGDHGIDSDPAVIFHDDFEGNDVLTKWDNCYQKVDLRIVKDPSNVHGGKMALQFTVPKQQNELSNAVVKNFGGQDVVFFRYYSKFEKGFDQTGSSHNGGMLNALAPGMPDATPGIRANGLNKFVVSYEDWRGEVGTPSPGELNVYVYHPEMRTNYGDHFYPSGKVSPHSAQPGHFGPGFVARPDVTPELDRWYCYELMVKANKAGSRDGRIAFWLDGKLIADFPGLRLRDADSLKINSAVLSLHIRNNTVRENKKWYDDAVIATSYIGPVFQKP